MSTRGVKLSRRGFLGLTAAGALVAGAGLAGCSSQEPKAATASDEAEGYTPGTIVETIDTDIVVVGLGMSGLSAAVQAANNGDAVVGIEATGVTGGNGIGVEGIFAVGTDMQKKAGIEIEPVEVVQTELEEAQMVTDGALWKKLVQSSADNVSWLMEQGVQFSGVVDDYLGSGIVSGFHWFEGNIASEGYIPQMTQRAEELGVDMRFNTPAKALITENGKVVGVFAHNQDGGDIQINAKAVILATGGYAQNQKFMEERGFNWENIVYGGTPGHNGDGLTMALEAGARSFVKTQPLTAQISSVRAIRLLGKPIRSRPRSAVLACSVPGVTSCG